jgi:type I restriction enzyme S subunit
MQTWRPQANQWVLSLKLAVPPSDEQKKIADYLDARVGAFDSLTATANTAISLLQERRAALISAAVTGKIDVRNLAQLETVAA